MTPNNEPMRHIFLTSSNRALSKNSQHTHNHTINQTHNHRPYHTISLEFFDGFLSFSL